MITMLIVDDEKIERNGIALLVKRLGLPMEATQAENGEAALEMLRRRQYDLLFTDIKMPFMDGLTLAHEARTLYPDIVVIIFSAYSDFEKAQRAIREQVYRYLLKPVQIGEFKSVMQACIEDIDRLRQDREAQDRMDHLLDRYRRQEAMLRSCLDGEMGEGDLREKLLELLKLSQASLPEIDNPAVLKALSIIHSEHEKELSLDDVAARVCLAPGYFSALFKQQTGVGFVKYLNNYRLDVAARALLETSDHVNEIAAAVGLPGESYFISLFKQRFGMTPRTFRQRMGEKP